MALAIWRESCCRDRLFWVFPQFLFVATKWLGLTNSYRLHGMKFVLFSEQHWSNYLGGCSIVYTRNCNLLAIPLLWFLSGPWPRENGVAMLSCPFHQVRMVGNTLKCSINALFFLVLPYCSTSLSYDYYISRVSSPPSHQLFFHGVTAGESRVRRGTIGPLGVPPGNWTAGSSCLKEDWRWYLGGGP